MDIGKKLRDRRKDLGLTQKAVAGELSISNSYLCDIERGRVQPSLKIFMKLSRVLLIEDINIFLIESYVKTETEKS